MLAASGYNDRYMALRQAIGNGASCTTSPHDYCPPNVTGIGLVQCGKCALPIGVVAAKFIRLTHHGIACTNSSNVRGALIQIGEDFLLEGH